MKSFLARLAIFAIITLPWAAALHATLSWEVNLVVIVGAILLAFPVVWTGRRLLDQEPSPERVVWAATFVHAGLLMLLGAAILRAVISHADWRGWVVPVPEPIGRMLVILTSLAALGSVVNLALKGLGAPFAAALSRKLAVDWLYAHTRNPMVIATLAFLVSLGLWYQSALFTAWVILLVTPAWVYFVVVFEERELEIRFGAAYLAYKARVPRWFPKL